MVREIANGVYVQPGRYVEERRGLVCGTKWCILIDAPRHFDEAEELRRLALKKNEAGVKLVILTHGHLDHIATLQQFPDISVIATEAAREYMLSKGQKELDRMKKDDEELQRIRQVMPEITLSGEAVVFDGTGRSLRCIPAPGHSMDSQMVLLEPDGILFAGDTLSAAVPPYFPDGNSKLLKESLKKILALRPRTVVPGHGRILMGEEVESETQEAIWYLENLRRLVEQEVEHGDSADVMRGEINWKNCSNKPVPTDEYLSYHYENIEKMATEIAKEKVAADVEPSARI